MLSLAALLPHPPLLVPELTGSLGSPQVDELRTACRTAATRLAAAAPTWLAVGVGDGARRTIGPDTAGTFLGYGVDVQVALGPGEHAAPDPTLPLPALIAGWLRAQVGDAITVRLELVPADYPVDDCVALGRQLAAECAGPEPVGLLALGDGSYRHPDRGPGTPDDRAPAFDTAIGETLEAADVAALLALDPVLTAELGAARAPWQVLAAAVHAAWPATVTDLLYSAAPFGVGYHVAVWSPA